MFIYYTIVLALSEVLGRTGLLGKKRQLELAEADRQRSLARRAHAAPNAGWLARLLDPPEVN
jgi:hypothetical protein